MFDKRLIKFYSLLRVETVKISNFEKTFSKNALRFSHVKFLIYWSDSLGNPYKDQSIRGDPYRTLFVSRLVRILINFLKELI